MSEATGTARTWSRPSTNVAEPPRSPLAQFQAAVDLYRGDFLAGFSLPDAPDFDDWASLQREAWHRRIDPVFDHLSQGQAEAGDIGSALDTTARWVAHHPLNEAVYRRLMQLHFAEGNQVAALQAYETCRTTLERELRAKPGPETETLAQRIQRMNASHEGGRMKDTPAVPDSSFILHPSSFITFPFVGRANEHIQLAATYYAARRGRIQIVTLEGEPGIGKTRLAKEFLGWVASQGADVLQGRAFETGGRLPYQPLVEALRDRLEQENAPDDLLADVWLTELSRLLPEQRDWSSIPPSVRELIRTRLARLSQEALTACTAGAVLGDGFDFEHLCSVAGLDESKGLPAVDELLRRGLLRESGGRCFFGHD
ncbi:MAG: AAA family ATPase [Chloroflexi bacterium]|nr:AAA family ATPase [Chloroflexota bacterium]